MKILVVTLSLWEVNFQFCLRIAVAYLVLVSLNVLESYFLCNSALFNNRLQEI